MMVRRVSVSLISLAVLALAGPSLAATWVANPQAGPGESGYYLDLVGQLAPGDTLQLPAGTYSDRLNLNGLQGTADAWITIKGPGSGSPAIVTTNSTCCNTVQLGNTWFVALENLTIDSRSDALNTSIDAINAKGGITHDILIQDCRLVGLSMHQQTVGISTKSTAWNWTIRRNTIIEAGTGMYLGNPDGSSPFVAGLIENNLIVDTIGYNMEIKHQNPYSPMPGMPAEPRTTIIRNNVFLKRRAQSSWPSSKLSGARPNLLVSGFPETGSGSADLYEIYANFFYMNPDESLFQGSGRFAIHDNIMVGDGGTAMALQSHDLPLKLAHVYNNTIYGTDTGIRFLNSARQEDAVVGNLIFASSPISGAYTAGNSLGNITDSVANAGQHVIDPSLELGTMDFYPKPGRAQGNPLDLSRFSGQRDFDLDFNGDSKNDFRFRGAYSGEQSNPGWTLDATLKVGGPSSGDAGGENPPPTPTGVQVD